MINCPSCGSSHVVKDGIRLTAYGETQRYLCKVCYVRFSLGDNIVVKKPSRVGLTSVMGSQVCAILQEAKNLNNATIEKVAGDKPKQNAILEYAWSMKKQGLATSTISNRVRGLNRLISLGAQLESTSSVETVLATETFTCSVKLELVRIYKAYCSCHGIIWKPTKVRYERPDPFLPLESEIDSLISGCGKRTSTLLQVLKDTGARVSEACRIKWTAINEANHTIAINSPSKGSRARTVKVSDKTLAMIKALPNKYDPYVFCPNPGALRDSFYRSREVLARKLQNPRLRQIHFHTFRHFKATMEYHKTHDILHVQQLLGHKEIANTQIYTHLVEFQNEDYHSATAKTVQEAKQLVESGFEYVCEIEDFKLFRKRK